MEHGICMALESEAVARGKTAAWQSCSPGRWTALLLVKDVRDTVGTLFLRLIVGRLARLESTGRGEVLQQDGYCCGGSDRNGSGENNDVYMTDFQAIRAN